METGTIGLLIWLIFFALHFFATQRLYCSRHFYPTVFLMLFLSLSLFMFFRQTIYGTEISIFSVPHFSLLRFATTDKIRLQKAKPLIRKKGWIAQTFADKDFTYVTHAYEGLGDDIWDEKCFSKPSWLDYIFSYGLLFLPIFLILATMWVVRGG